MRSLRIQRAHLTPLTKQRWQGDDGARPPPLPERTIVQTYHCDRQLILSETIKCYLEMGAQVEIEEFFQYQAAHAFTPFCERVISLRKRSKRERNAPMGTTAKLIGNSAYGKTLGKRAIYMRQIKDKLRKPVSIYRDQILFTKRNPSPTYSITLLQRFLRFQSKSCRRRRRRQRQRRQRRYNAWW